MRGSSSLYLQIYQYIRDAILAEEFQVGDMIPTEQELMQMFGVSRITTNRALQMLTTDGFVVRKPGIGTFVRAIERDESTQQTQQTQQTQPRKSETPVTRLCDNDELGAMVGLIIPFLDGSFGRSLISHVERMVNERGMAIVLTATYGSQQKEQDAINRLVQSGVKGLIVMPVNGEYYNESILRLCVDHFPVVLVDKTLPGIPIPTVMSDNYNAAKQLSDHLISLRHRRIVFLSPPLNGTSTLIDRYRGFLDSLQAAGITPIHEHHFTVTMVGGQANGIDDIQVKAIAKFLSDHPDVTAVVASDDHLAEHVLAAGIEIGRRIPEDLSIVCFDGQPVKKGLWNFSHAIQDEEEMARQCIRILDDLWAGKSLDTQKSVVVPCRFHFGESTATVCDTTDINELVYSKPMN